MSCALACGKKKPAVFICHKFLPTHPAPGGCGGGHETSGNEWESGRTGTDRGTGPRCSTYARRGAVRQTKVAHRTAYALYALKLCPAVQASRRLLSLMTSRAINRAAKRGGGKKRMSRFAAYAPHVEHQRRQGGAATRLRLSRSIELYTAIAHVALSTRFLSRSTDCHAFI
jgi:hypothetical protein